MALNSELPLGWASGAVCGMHECADKQGLFLVLMRYSDGNSTLEHRPKQDSFTFLSALPSNTGVSEPLSSSADAAKNQGCLPAPTQP